MPWGDGGEVPWLRRRMLLRRRVNPVVSTQMSYPYPNGYGWHLHRVRMVLSSSLWTRASLAWRPSWSGLHRGSQANRVRVWAHVLTIYIGEVLSKSLRLLLVRLGGLELLFRGLEPGGGSSIISAVHGATTRATHTSEQLGHAPGERFAAHGASFARGWGGVGVSEG